MTSLLENFVLCKTIALSILVLSKCRHKARDKASHQSSIRVQPFSTVRISVSFKNSNLKYITKTIYDQFIVKLLFKCKKIALSILMLSKCRHKASHKASHQNSIRVQPFSTVSLSVNFKSSS